MRKYLPTSLALFVFGAIVAVLCGLVVMQGGSATPQNADANSVDDCHFINSDNDTYNRAKHLNGYNNCVTAAYMEKVLAAEPYPSDITDSLDRKMHIEQLRRFQDPNKLGYMYLLGMNGNVITWYTINGKPSSTQSSLTPDLQAGEVGKGQVLPSAADDGSFGPNEGGDQGVLFFTTSGCMIEHAPTWIYSDCPLNIAAAPLTIATLDLNAKPSSAIASEFGGNQ